MDDMEESKCHSFPMGDVSGSGDGSGGRPGSGPEAAREAHVKLRNPTAAVGGNGTFKDDSRGSGDNRRKSRLRLSLLDVNYGAASVKRESNEDFRAAFSSLSFGDGTSPPSGYGVRRDNCKRRSISAGEGVWLVQGNHHSGRRRKSSRFSVLSETPTSSQSLMPQQNGDVQMTAAIASKEKEAVIRYRTADTPTSTTSLMKTTTRGSRAATLPPTPKKVRFSTVTIRYHPVILGSNPFVTSGPPLELAWDCEPGVTASDIPIDSYEVYRIPRRRSELDLALSRGERESRLLESGCTREEIAAAVRETVRIKNQRANTVLNLKMAKIEEFVEHVRRRGTKYVGLRRSSNWLYNDWKMNRRVTSLSRGAGASPYGEQTTKAEQVGVSRGTEVVPVALPAKELETKPIMHYDRDSEKNTFGGTTDDPVPMTEAAPSRAAGRSRNTKENKRPEFGIAYTFLSTRVSLGNNPSNIKGTDEVAIKDDGGECDSEDMPFAVIAVVKPGSPAQEAGLRRGDRLVKIGGVTVHNHNNFKAIPELGQVAAVKERPVPAVVVGKDGVTRRATIHPRTWRGRGHFGFLLKAV